MSRKPKCVKCERTDTSVWTISQGGVAALVDLCPEHDEPLRDLLGSPANRKPPKPRQDDRIINKKPVPLRPLDWTPPD